MTIKVNHPSGHVEEFPEGTSAEEINEKMRIVDAQIKKKEAWEKNRQNMSWGDTAVDVAKSAGVGLAQGAIGAATVPFTVADLGAKVIDYAGSKIGHNPELSNLTENYLPTYENTKNKIEENITGEFYEPKSRLGQYARTVGEFAPTGGALGAVSRGSRVAKTLIPAVTSETAGQLTEGTKYEPVARVTGALTGGMLPNTAMRAVTPMRIDPKRAANIRALENEGITSLTAGDKTGSLPIQWMESVSRDMPLSGGKVQNLKDAQKRELVKAALRRVGENADDAGEETMKNAFSRLGTKFEDIIGNYDITGDLPLYQKIANTLKSYLSQKNQSARVPAIQNTAMDIINAFRDPVNKGKLFGKAYQSTRQELREIELRNLSTDSTTSDHARKLREAIDDAFERSVPPDVAQELRTARKQYRELLAINDAMNRATVKSSNGLFSAQDLARSIIKQDKSKREYTTGSRDQAKLAKAAQSVLYELPQTGTGPRINYQNIMNVGSGIAGSVYGPSVGLDPFIGGVLGAVGQAGVQGAVARTVMSPRVQNYLANQRLAPQIEYYNNALRPTLRNTAIPAATIADRNMDEDGRSFELYNR